MKNLYLFIDDERKVNFTNLPNNVIPITCRSYRSAIEALIWAQEREWPIYIDLDHDLGEKQTGYDICKYIVENNVSLLGYHLHTMNPVDRQNMDQLLSYYGYKPF